MVPFNGTNLYAQMMKKTALSIMMLLAYSFILLGQDLPIIQLNDKFSIFPKEQFGNSVYIEKRRIISIEDLIIRDIIEAPGGFVYYGQNKSDEPVLDFVGQENVTFWHSGGPYYTLKVKRGATKLFRLDTSGKIQSVLGRSNTASGLIHNGSNAAAFTHIAKGETVEVDGKTLYQYSFKVHVINDDTGKIKTIPGQYTSLDARLKIKWASAKVLKIPLENGQSKAVTVR